MNRKLIYGLCALFIALIIAIVAIRVWGGSVDTPSIVIPSPSPEAGDSELGGSANRLEVSPETVRELLQHVDRSDVYSRGYQLFTYWDGGEAEARVNVWQKGELFRVKHNQNNVIKNILISGSDVHYWYEGSKSVYSASLSDTGDDVLDDYARLITLEELMSLPDEDILRAGYDERDGESCIYVEYESDGNRVYRLYVSVNNGLLISAEVLENDSLIYLLRSVITESSIPSDDIFLLP